MSREAKREFKRVLKVLAENNQQYVTAIDTAALASYAVNYAAWMEAEKHISTEGTTVQRPIINRSSGNISGHIETPSIWLKVSKDRQQSMLRAIQALGFDPRSRTSIDIPAPRPRRYTAPTTQPNTSKPLTTEEAIAKWNI